MSESHGCEPPDVDQRVEFEKLIQIFYLSLNPDSSVSSGSQFEDCVAKLSHLHLSELSSIPNRIQLEEENIRRKTEQLAVENYPIFLANAQTSRDVHREFISISELNVNLLSSIAEVSGAAQNIVDNIGKNASSFRTYANSIQRCTHILEFLELPQLMETSIQNGYYQDALNILNHIKQMVKKYCRLVPIVRVVGLQAQEIGWHLFNQLCKQLREPITLPVCLKVVIYLRQLDAFNELELRLNFLQARGICIRDQLEIALSRPIGMPNFESSTTKLTDIAGCRQLECKAFIRAMRRIEVTRVQLFDSITQYRAVFVDDDAYSTKLTDQQTLLADLSPIYFNETPRTLRRLLTSGVDDLGPCNGTSLFHAWLVRQIGAFLDGLNADLDSLLFLPHLTPSEISDRIQMMTMANDSISFGTVDISTAFQQIHSIMAQALYFGRSFARIGCDFRAHLGPIFSRAISSYVNALLVNASLELSVVLELWPWELSETSLASEQLGETNPNEIPAPIAIAHHPPLAFFCNRLLTLFNGLRICCPISLRDRVLSACIRTLSEAAVAITTAYKFQQLDSTTDQGQGPRLANVFVHTAVPHLLTCLLDHVFGGDALAHLWQLRPEVEEILTTSRIVSQLTRQVCAPIFAVWAHLSVGPPLTNDESSRIQHEHISLPLAVENRKLSEVQNAEAKSLSGTSLIVSETPFSVEQDLSAKTVLETEPPSISPAPQNNQEMLISTVTLTSSGGEDDTRTIVEPARSTQIEETSAMSSQEPLDFNSSNTLVTSQLGTNATSFPVEMDSSILESDRGSSPFSGNKIFIGSDYPFMATAPEFLHKSTQELQGEETSITLSVDQSNFTVRKELGEEAVAFNAEKPKSEEVSPEPVESSLETTVSLTLSDADVQKSSASELALSLNVGSPVNLLPENEKEELVCDKIAICDSDQRELDRTTCSPLEIPAFNNSNAERPSDQINLNSSAPMKVLPMDDSSINQENLENQCITLDETKSHRFEDVVPDRLHQYISTIKEQVNTVHKEENVDSGLTESKSVSSGDALFNVNFPDIPRSPPSICSVVDKCKLEPVMLKPEEVNAFGVTQEFVPTPSEPQSLDSRLSENIYDALKTPTSLIAPSTVVCPPSTMEPQLDINETVDKHNETDFCGRVEDSVDERLAVQSAPSQKEFYLTSGEKSLDNPADDESQLISDDSVTSESEGGKIWDTRSIPVPVFKRGNSVGRSLSELRGICPTHSPEGSETVNEFADWSSDADAWRSSEDADDHTVGAHDVSVIACKDALDVEPDQEPQSLMGANAVFSDQDVPTQPAEGCLTDGDKSDAPSSFIADDNTVMKMAPTDLISKLESPSTDSKQTYDFINAENRRPMSPSFSMRDIEAKTKSPADKDIAFFATDTELREVERGNEENLQEGRVSESRNEESNKLLETDKSADTNIVNLEEKGDICTVDSTDQRSLVMPQSESVERRVEEHQYILQPSGTGAKMPPLGDENLAKDKTKSATQSAEVMTTYGEECKYKGNEDQINSHSFTSSDGPETQMQETETDELYCEEEEDFTGGDIVSDQNPQTRHTPDSEGLLKSKWFNDERSDNGRVDVGEGSMLWQALEPPTSQKGNRPTSREFSLSGPQGKVEALAVSHFEPDVSSVHDVLNVPGQNVDEAGSVKFKGICEADQNSPDSGTLSTGGLDTEQVDKIDVMANKEKEESSEILTSSENEPHFHVSGLDQSKTAGQFAETETQEPINQSTCDKTKITDLNEAGKFENFSDDNVFESQSVGVEVQQSEMEEPPSFGAGKVGLTFAGGVSSKEEEALKVANLWDDNTNAWSENPDPEANSSFRVETSFIENLDKDHRSVDPDSKLFGREAGLTSAQSVNALRCSLSDCASRDATSFRVHDSDFHEADTTEPFRNESPSSNADWEEDCENAWGRDADIDVGDEEIQEILCDKEFNESTTSASESKMIRQSHSVGFHSDLRDSTGNGNDDWRINSDLAISQSSILDTDPRCMTDLTDAKHWDPTTFEEVACERAVSDEAKLGGESIDDRCHHNFLLLPESELHGSKKFPILGVTADDSTYVGGDANNSGKPMSDDPDRNIGVDDEEGETDNSTGDTSIPLELFAIQPSAADEPHMSDGAELGVAASADKAKESDRQEDAPRTKTFNLDIVDDENDQEGSKGVLGAQISVASGEPAIEVEQGEADATYRGGQETLSNETSAEEDSTEKHSVLSEKLPKTSDWYDDDHEIPLELARGDHGSEYVGSGFCVAGEGDCIAEEPKSVEALVPPSSRPGLSQPDPAPPPRADADRQTDTLSHKPAGDFTASNVLNPESVAVEPSSNPFLTSASGKDAAGGDEIAEGWDVDF